MLTRMRAACVRACVPVLNVYRKSSFYKVNQIIDDDQIIDFESISNMSRDM